MWARGGRRCSGYSPRWWALLGGLLLCFAVGTAAEEQYYPISETELSELEKIFSEWESSQTALRHDLSTLRSELERIKLTSTEAERSSSAFEAEARTGLDGLRTENERISRALEVTRAVAIGAGAAAAVLIAIEIVRILIPPRAAPEPRR